MKKFKMKKLLQIGIVLIAVGGIGFYFYQKTKPAQEDTAVMTGTAAIGDVESVITGTGTLNPANQYDVKSLVKGKILSADFEEGDTVKKGDALYQISTREITNTIKSSKLALKKAEQTYQDYLEKKKNLVQKAPVRGYIKKLYVKEGDKVQSGANIADIYNGDTMYLDLYFPASMVKKSWIGKKATILMDSSDATTTGTISTISSLTETQSGGILSKKITIQLSDTSGIGSNDTASAKVSGISSISSASFRPESAITVTATSEGTIEQLSVSEGSWIDQGDALLSLSSIDLNNQIRDAKLSVQEAKLSLKTQQAQENLYTITSPISGTVILKSKKSGDTIDPGADTQAGPMATIYDMNYMTFQLNIDELQISNIKKGQKVVITSEAFPSQTFKGTIDRISLKGTTNNGITSYPVMVRLDSYGSLLPGMNVNGKVIIQKVSQVLTIPSSALQRDEIVYLQKSGAQSDDATVPKGFVAVKVKTGLNDGNNVEIKDGLKEGDVVYIPFDNSVESTYQY